MTPDLAPFADLIVEGRLCLSPLAYAYGVARSRLEEIARRHPDAAEFVAETLAILDAITAPKATS